MTKDSIIIGLVRELQSWQKALERHGRTDKFAEEDFRKKIDNSFPAIAQALLTKDEQLKIATTAIEEAHALHMHNSTEPHSLTSHTQHQMAIILGEAISQIRSLPTQTTATPVAAELTMTCEACPSQWEGKTTDGSPIFAQFHHGGFQLEIGDKVVFRVNCAGDGVMSIEEMKELVRDHLIIPF